MTTFYDGYLGVPNLGDQLLLERSIRLVGESHEQLCYVRSSRQTTMIGSSTVAPNLTPSVGVREQFRCLQQSDMVVVVGGALMKDSSAMGGMSGTFARWPAIVGTDLGLPVVWLSLGSGRTRHNAGTWAQRRLLRTCGVYVEAREVLPEHLVDLPDLVRPDGVFDLVKDDPKEENHPPRKNSCGVVLAGHLQPLASWRLLLDEATKQFEDVTLFVLEAGDQELATTLQDSINPSTNCSITRLEDTSGSEATDLLGSVSHLITGRFHGAILASRSDNSLAVLNLDPKLERIANELDVPLWQSLEFMFAKPKTPNYRYPHPNFDNVVKKRIPYRRRVQALALLLICTADTFSRSRVNSIRRK